MAGDWFDPFGMRRITDAMSTTAARSLIGRPIEVDARGLSAVVGDVREAAPSSNVGAMLSGQLGLWRRLDVDLVEVKVRENAIDRVRVVADDVRAIEALPQRIGARTMDVELHVGPEATRGWIASLAPPDADVRIVDGEALARLPGFGRYGDVLLEPWFEDRSVGIRVERARVGSRRVNLPQRFHRRFDSELDWLPEGAVIESIEITEDDGVEIRGTIDRYSIEVDVAALMADLTTRQAGAVIDVLLGS